MSAPGDGPGPGQPTQARGWLARRTLRGRLIAGLLALLAVACAAVGLVTYVALHSALLNQLDTQLMAASQRYEKCLQGPPPDADSDLRPPPGHTPDFCAQQQAVDPFSAQGHHRALRDNYLAGGPYSSDKCPLAPTDRVVLTSAPAGDEPFSRDLSHLGEYRLLASPGPGGTVYLTGLSLAPVESTLRQVEIVEALVFAGALLLTGVLGTGFVRLSLRPLRRVAATATQVTERPLASGEVTLPERVPDTNPRTEVGQVGLAFNRMLGHGESAPARRAAPGAAGPRPPPAARGAPRWPPPGARRSSPAGTPGRCLATSRTRCPGWSRSRPG